MEILKVQARKQNIPIPLKTINFNMIMRPLRTELSQLINMISKLYSYNPIIISIGIFF